MLRPFSFAVASLFLLILNSNAHPDDTCPNPGQNPVFTLPQELNDAVCKPYSSTHAEIHSLLKSLLAPRVHTLHRKVYFYHYAQYRYPMGPGGCIGLDEKTKSGGLEKRLADQYFETRAKPYFDNRDYSSGLYMAPDPLMSIDFSDHPGLLLRVGIPEGTRFLDAGPLHPSPDEGMKIWCYLQSQCKGHDCKKQDMDGYVKEMIHPSEVFPDGKGGLIPKKAELTLDPGAFLWPSQETAAILKGIYSELGIEFSIDDYRRSAFADCPRNSGIEAVFTDPSFSSKAETTLLTPCLEKNAPAAKKKLYGDLLSYWENPNLRLEGDCEAPFWEYYQAWAPAVHGLAPGSDLKEFQKKQTLKNAKTRHSDIFGCSDDPKYASEVAPSL